MSERPFIPQWRRMTWALVLFTAFMAISAIVAGVALEATETTSAAEIRGCLVGTDSSTNPQNFLLDQDCRDALGHADDVVSLIFILWVVGIVILFVFWFRSRPRSPARSRPSGSLRRRP